MAVPFLINSSDSMVPMDDEADDHLLILPEERNFDEADMTAYANYERAYDQALFHVEERLSQIPRNSVEWYKGFVTAMATEFCRMGLPEEETVCHLWRHLTDQEYEQVSLLVLT